MTWANAAGLPGLLAVDVDPVVVVGAQHLRVVRVLELQGGSQELGAHDRAVEEAPAKHEGRAATAAVLSVDEGVSVQDLPYSRLRERLLPDGQVLELPRKN